MRILVDTSVIVRAAQPNSPAHTQAIDAIDQLESLAFEACLVPQVLYEYWVVATRPTAQNGLGRSIDATWQSIELLKDAFFLLRDERAIFELWSELVVRHHVKGKGGHDARLVAAMQRHKLDRILTFNSQDFARFPGITILTPSDLLTRSTERQ